MPDDDDAAKFADDFLSRFDSGELDKDLASELGRLTTEQRGELAQVLAERQAMRQKIN